MKKRRGPPSSGPVVNLQLALGFASMQEFADAIGKNAANLRSWNRRKSIPADAQAKIDRLLAARRPRKS
jgi:DNA-binding transcriptional regulator YiaG